MEDADFRALQEQSFLLAELKKHAGWPVLVDYLLTRAESNQRRVLQGTIKSYEEYKAITGELVGIDKAIHAADEVFAMVEAERERRVRDDKPLT